MTVYRSTMYKATIPGARTLIEKDPAFTPMPARLLLQTMAREVLGRDVVTNDMGNAYAGQSPISSGKALQPNCWTNAWHSSTCNAWRRTGGRARPPVRLPRLQTLYDRYFQHPQATHRTAAGLSCALPWGWRSTRLTGKPVPLNFTKCFPLRLHGQHSTLFNSGTRRAQLSSCYLTTVPMI